MISGLVLGCKLMKNLTLITGGARSGKSKLAEQLAAESGLPVVYLATMEVWANDKEGVDRVARHKQRRPHEWTTLEVPVDVSQAVTNLPHGPSAVILDCLSVYVSNLLLMRYEDGQDPYLYESDITSAVDKLLSTISDHAEKKFILVTNEVGFGVVPDTVLGRAYRDFLGNANQWVAQVADDVRLMCAGLQVKLK
jgi:adenosylcobinamide kinase / adenosylcobinamide-phosphate guanylyltransferase